MINENIKNSAAVNIMLMNRNSSTDEMFNLLKSLSIEQNSIIEAVKLLNTVIEIINLSDTEFKELFDKLDSVDYGLVEFSNNIFEDYKIYYTVNEYTRGPKIIIYTDSNNKRFIIKGEEIENV